MTQCQCSFCGMQQDQVKRLIAGPGVYICDKCIQFCQEILDHELGGEEPGTPSDEATDRPGAPRERVPDILSKETVHEALKNLSYRERRVLELRYGLSGEHPRTLDDVGRTFKLTGAQVRQIELESLEKLQSSAELRPD